MKSNTNQRWQRVAVSSTISGVGTVGQKRKSPELFVFQVHQLCISMFAQIETQQRKSSVGTGVPAGKTNKEIIYSLLPFIIGGKHDSKGESISSSNADEVADEEFV